MEAVVKKQQQKFKRAKEEIDRWTELQARILSQFRNASSIIDRLPVIHETKNYGILSCVDGISGAVVEKQMESLDMILLSLKQTLEELRGIVVSLDKIVQDSRQLVKGGSTRLTAKQLQHRIGVKPTVQDCVDGLMLLHDMYNSEYLLKSSIVSALPAVILKPRVGDLGALQRLLVDQPNIVKEESVYTSTKTCSISFLETSAIVPCSDPTPCLYIQFSSSLTSSSLKISASSQLNSLNFYSRQRENPTPPRFEHTILCLSSLLVASSLAILSTSASPLLMQSAFGRIIGRD